VDWRGWSGRLLERGNTVHGEKSGNGRVGVDFAGRRAVREKRKKVSYGEAYGTKEYCPPSTPPPGILGYIYQDSKMSGTDLEKRRRYRYRWYDMDPTYFDQKFEADDR
jgi:hypothetical protein